MAIGARPSDIFKRYIMQGLQLSFAGIAIGLCVAIACRESLRSFLYQVQPLDPMTLFLAALGVIAVSAVAGIGPSWRASHVDPQTALRTE